MRGSFCVHAGWVKLFNHTEPVRTDGVLYHCPGHSIQHPQTGHLYPPYGTFLVTRDEFVYQLREERHAWPIKDVAGFTAIVSPGSTTAVLGDGPAVLVSVRDPKALPKLQAAVRLAQLSLLGE